MNGGTRSYEFAKRLVQLGHEVNVVTSWREGGKSLRWTKSQVDGVNVHWFPIKYSNHFRNYQRLRAFVEFIFRSGLKAASIESDIVFATSTPLTIALPGVYAASRLHVPMVLEVRDLWPQAPIAIGALKRPITKNVAFKLESWAYEHAAHIVSLSPNMTAYIEKKCPSASVTEIPNCSDLERFDPTFLDRERFRLSHPEFGDSRIVTYAGALGHVNNVGYLALIAREALDRNLDVRFLVIGDGIEKKIIFDQAALLGVLNRNFFMLPPVPKREMPDVLAATDLSLSLVADVPELWGNSANKFFDALAASTPIAVNHSGWQAELITKNGIGLVLPNDNPGVAAELIADFFSDPTTPRSAGAAARRLAKEHFDVNALARKLELVFTTVVDNS